MCLWRQDYRDTVHIAPSIISYGYQNIADVSYQRISEKTFSEDTQKPSGFEIIECNIQIDQVPMVMIIPPKYSVADAIGQIKAQSSGYKRSY